MFKYYSLIIFLFSTLIVSAQDDLMDMLEAEAPEENEVVFRNLEKP